MPPASAAPTQRLDPAERDALARDGYVVRPGAFTGEEVAQLRADCESLTEQVTQRRPPPRKIPMGAYLFQVHPELATIVKWEPEHPDTVQGVEPFAHFHEPMRRWAADPRFVDPMKDLLATEEVGLFTEKLNLKRGGRGGPIVLHQDYPYWVANTQDPGEVATAIVFLHDADRRNGCLEVVPGSHRQGLQPTRKVAGFGSFEMDGDLFDGAPLVPVEVAAGSVVMFGSLLVHASTHNTSDQDRCALLFSYQPAGRPPSVDSLREQIRSYGERLL